MACRKTPGWKAACRRAVVKKAACRRAVRRAAAVKRTALQNRIHTEWKHGKGKCMAQWNGKDQWKEENQSAIMEYPFDLERYIEERIREIDDLDERRFAKTALLEGLGKIARCMEEKYKRLERRIYEELETEGNRYETVTTVVRREYYDPTNATLFPVAKEDLAEEERFAKLSSETEQYAGTIFLQADEKTAEQFLQEGSFPGVLPGEEEKSVIFHVKRAGRYRQQVEQLYHVFQDNHIPWMTVHMGFLDKFFDLFIEIPEDRAGRIKEGQIQKEPRQEGQLQAGAPRIGILQAGAPQTGALQTGAQQTGQLQTGEPQTETLKATPLQEMQIDFGAYEESVRYDMIPLWNVESIRFDSANFMMPCMDGICYEHEFSLQDTEKGDGYLICANEDILEIRHEEGKIIIKSEKETFEGWQALHIVQRETEKSLNYDFPLLSNHKKDSFFRRNAEKTGVQLMTKTDLFRRIMELDIGGYMEVTGYEICEDAKHFPARESMNPFILDELFPMEGRKVLLLKFEEKTSGHYLNDSMVRFAVSQIQTEIGEYRCVGVIIPRER